MFPEAVDVRMEAGRLIIDPRSKYVRHSGVYPSLNVIVYHSHLQLQRTVHRHIDLRQLSLLFVACLRVHTNAFPVAWEE